MPVSFVFVQDPPTEIGIPGPAPPLNHFGTKPGYRQDRARGLNRNAFSAKTNGNARKRKIMRGVWTTSKTGKRKIRVQTKYEKRKRAGLINCAQSLQLFGNGSVFP